jgi:hypothetical protein
MASTHPYSQAIGSSYRSCGRGFAAVDPERLREVEFSVRRTPKVVPAPGGPRGAPTQWFNPPRAPSQPGGSRSGR